MYSINNQFVAICAGIIFLIVIVTSPLRVKLVLKKAGVIKIRFTKKKVVLQYFIVVVSAVIIALLYFRNLGLLNSVIVSAVAVLGTVMGTEEIVLNGCSGLYENGIIANGRFLGMQEIYCIADDSSASCEIRYTNRISVQTEKRGIVNFSFLTEEERTAVFEELIKIKPSLKKS